MRVLFIGGTGLISSACTQLAAKRGIDLCVLNRGRTGGAELPAGVDVITVDVHDRRATAAALGGRAFDVVVDWIAFTPEHVQRDIDLFAGSVRQYIFISSASAYQKPPTSYLVTESTPLANPHWQYSRDKAACEELLIQEHRRSGFPFTVVRPSLTYGPSMIPLAVNNWSRPFTIIERMRSGRKTIVPGDGTSLWTCTWNGDFARAFVGLLGHQQAIGHAFHITSDEVLTWNQIYTETAHAAGVEPNLIHIPSEFLMAFCPEEEGNLLGDKAQSTVFDNSKIKRFVPDFVATTTFAQGIRKTLAWFEADAARCAVSEESNAVWDRIVDAYESGLARARG